MTNLRIQNRIVETLHFGKTATNWDLEKREYEGEDGILNRIGYAAVALVTMFACTEAFAQEKKVLFFEAALSPTDNTFSTEPSGYSKLSDALKDAGMLVASMSSGVITRQKLSPYEVVVLHPSPERPLRKGEISSLVWFVAQNGGALFVHGGVARTVNPLTEIFGISMDTGRLIDTSTAMDESAAGRSFALTRFPSRSGFGPDAIESIGFHGGAPLVLSQDAVELVTGDDDCYSDNGLYSIGSFPPVAAMVYLGRGVLLVKSDRTFLNNANIESYQNLKWAKAVFESLASARETRADRDQSLFGLRAHVDDLKEAAEASRAKFKESEADLAAGYEKIRDLEKKLGTLEEKNRDITAKLKTIETERNKLSDTLAKYRSPDTLKAIAIGAGAVLLVVLLIGLVIGRRTMRDKA